MAILANIVKNGALVNRNSWERHVERLKAAVTADADASANNSENKISSKNYRKTIKKILKQKLEGAVAKRMPNKRFGIMFSGGVDSSTIALIAKKLKGDFICYSVGMENSKDVIEAKKAAKKLRLHLRCKIFSLKEAEKIIKRAVAIVGEPDVVNAGVAAVEIAAAAIAKKDKIRTFFCGLGSEEIFAGYRRHETAKDVNSECWNGLKNMHGRDLIRDCKVSAAAKINFLLPFLDKDLIIEAMKIPGKYKISSSDKKIILREAAADLGLPKQVAFRKKLAAQYGSGFDRAIGKLARKNGFKRKKGYLESLLQ